MLLGEKCNFSVNLQAIVNIDSGENSRRRPTSSKRKLMGTKIKRFWAEFCKVWQVKPHRYAYIWIKWAYFYSALTQLMSSRLRLEPNRIEKRNNKSTEMKDETANNGNLCWLTVKGRRSCILILLSEHHFLCREVKAGHRIFIFLQFNSDLQEPANPPARSIQAR